VNPHDDPALAAAFAETEAIYTAALDARIQSGAAFGGSVSLPDSRSERRAPAPETPGEPTTFPLTDAGNAEYFAARYGADLRYDHRRGRWLHWQGHRWAPDADGAVHRLALLGMRQRGRDALDLDGKERERAVVHALRSESRQRLDALLAIARCLHPLADVGDQWDADLWLLGTPAGILDLRTGAVRDGQPADRITMSTCVAPEDRPAPRWERFIAEITGGDPELAAFLMRALGYALTGDTGEQCLFVAYGTGANGKGTLTQTITDILGDYAHTMPFSTVELHQRAAIPNDLAALVGRRFVSASETNDGTRLNESRIKALTGCDPISARFLHGEFFTFRPVGKYWLSVNHRPVVRDLSYGFWRRMRLIPFTQRFDVDPTLAPTLRDEAPAILAWLVRGCLAWQRDGLVLPAVVREATREYEADSDPLGEFVSARCEVDPDATIGASEFYRLYRAWAEEQGIAERDRISATRFGRLAGERWPRVHGRGGKTYRGIRAVTGFSQ
jgi:putative DNA primase/helicase